MHTVQQVAVWLRRSAALQETLLNAHVCLHISETLPPRDRDGMTGALLAGNKPVASHFSGKTLRQQSHHERVLTHSSHAQLARDLGAAAASSDIVL